MQQIFVAPISQHVLPMPLWQDKVTHVSDGEGEMWAHDKLAAECTVSTAALVGLAANEGVARVWQGVVV